MGKMSREYPPMTKRQQELAERYVPYVFRLSMDRDWYVPYPDRVSIGMERLCVAAICWDFSTDRPFIPYLKSAVIRGWRTEWKRAKSSGVGGIAVGGETDSAALASDMEVPDWRHGEVWRLVMEVCLAGDGYARHRTALQMWVDGSTWVEIGKTLGVSRQRISQLLTVCKSVVRASRPDLELLLR